MVELSLYASRRSWNFGSMDGDGAAAQRYTEARMSKIALGNVAGHQ